MGEKNEGLGLLQWKVTLRVLQRIVMNVATPASRHMGRSSLLNRMEKPLLLIGLGAVLRASGSMQQVRARQRSCHFLRIA